MCKNSCFVIMPFTNENSLNDFFEKKLGPLIKGMGYKCIRADTSGDQNLERSFIQGIYDADIIIADLTEKSCNVFYELGISHTFLKKTLMISQNLKGLPFDINKYKVREYDPEKFNEKHFKEWLKELKEKPECNPVSDNMPSITQEDSIFSEVAENILKKRFKTGDKKVILIDLDGSLFNSYKHRTDASIKAFQKIFNEFGITKKPEEWESIYLDIYNKHELYENLTNKNFRYNWRTIDIYCIAYLKIKKKIDPKGIKDRTHYLELCHNEINARALKSIEDAKDEFERKTFIPSPYAKQLLKTLKELDFKLILVTEGDQEVQKWKLSELGLNEYFPDSEDIEIGTPYEKLSNLKSHIEGVRPRNTELINKMNLIYEKYKKMQNEYKESFPNRILKEVIKKFGRIKIAVIGDRYDIDLRPYEKINKKNILRIAVVNESSYKEQTKTDIDEFNKKNKGEGSVRPVEIKNDLSEVLELLVNPETWEDLDPISTVPPIVKTSLKREELKEIEDAGQIILKYNPKDPSFVSYAADVIKYFPEEENECK